jgi:hypothetical protein
MQNSDTAPAVPAGAGSITVMNPNGGQYSLDDALLRSDSAGCTSLQNVRLETQRYTSFKI